MESVNFTEVFESSSSVTEQEIQRAVNYAAGPHAGEFRNAVEQAATSANPDVLTRAGIGLFYLGLHERAIAMLENCKSGLGRYYRAVALSSTGEYEQALKEFEQAEKAGHNGAACKLRRAGELRKLKRLEEAEAMIRSTGAEGARMAEYSYQMGCVLSDKGDTFGAIEYFERAVDMDPHHARALFALALQNSLYGNDEEAIQLYERCLSKPPFYTGALINLGLLYDDQENYAAAQYCFEKVLHNDPNNERARLYLKDIEATGDMYYDEETLRQQQKLEQLLARPVTDFELSVRSRNCLAAMDIETLGDLTKISEQELLSGKNFGETSLLEVRELMKQHGLSIGQNLHEKSREPSTSFKDLTPQEQAVMAMPVVDLDLSVRSRKCMARLGVTSIGELIQRTPDELLSAKNFGVTSLNELRLKLSELGVKLRND
ncbi:MAG: DNA-directed RNA polymerase subunit alpha C-terminal domain-containing protein [Planctomycetaceae bacterium]